MPCSETSRPICSTSGSVRIPTVTLISHSTTERGRERERADRCQPERLDAELVETAAVEEATLPGRELLGELRHGEEAERERAPHTRHAVRRDGADGIVDPYPLDERASRRRR